VEKESEQSHNVVQIRLRYPRRKLKAAHDNQIPGLQVHDDKLDHLAESEGRLPPDFLCVHRDEIVSVHDGVDKPVEHDGKIHIAVETDNAVEPVKQEDGEMVIDVQERQLVPAPRGDDKDRVGEIENLGKVKNVKHKGDGWVLEVESVAGKN